MALAFLIDPLPGESSREASPPEVPELPTEKSLLIQLSRDFADFRATVSRLLAAPKVR